MFEALFQDLKFGLRMLRKSPAFFFFAVITLAVGIGASTSIFSIADVGLLHPLPFPHPEQLVTVNEIVPLITDHPLRLTAPDLVDYQQQSHSFTALGGWATKTFELSGGHESERVQAVRATASIFNVLQRAPTLGRPFTEEEDRNAAPVCVISYGLWQRWFGADPKVLGQSVELDRIPYKVIGVMPRGFEFPLRGSFDLAEATDIWVPMSLTPKELQMRGDNWGYNGIARLKPGVTLAQASADVNAIAQHIATDLMPADRAGFMKFTALVQPLAQQVSGNVRPLVLALLGAVGFLLLIACINVANLLLARGASREKEVAVRAALGASRSRILRQLVAESLLLGIFAAVLGGLFAWWSTDALTPFVPSALAILANAHFSWRVLLFSCTIAVLTSVVVGVIPGIAATGGLRYDALKDRGASSAGVRHHRLRSILVVTEMGLALVLLVGAGLLARSFKDLLATDPGFAPEGAVAGFIDLPKTQYPDAIHEREFYRDLLERLRGQGTIEFAGIGTWLPLDAPGTERGFWPDQYNPPTNAHFNVAAMIAVQGEYFQAIGARLRRGRFFTPQDDAQSMPVAVVSESLARQYWPGQDPIGKRLKFGIKQTPTDWLTVVGEVDDVKQYSLDSSGAVQIYVPGEQVEHSIVAQYRNDFTPSQLRSMYVVLRGHGSNDALAAVIRDTVHAIDSQMAVSNLQAMEVTTTESAAPQRFNMLLMTGFSLIALVLAAIGIYGIASYSVAQRTQEIGIRMALGADASNVALMVLRGALLLALIGICIGSVAAVALAPLLRSLLFGVKPVDPLTFASVAVLLLIVAAIATYIPARRATKVDPMVALRYE